MSALDTVVLGTQLLLGIHFWHRGNVLGQIVLSTSAFYWVNGESIPFVIEIAAWIVAGGGTFLLLIIAPSGIWSFWRYRYLRSASRAFENGNMNQALACISEDKNQYGLSADNYAVQIQISMARRRFDESLALLDTAAKEGYIGANLDWFRVWSLCRLKRHSDALTWLEQQITGCSHIEITYALYLIYYARVYIDLQQTENAREVCCQLERWFVSYRELIPISSKSFVLDKYEECTKLFEAHLRGESLDAASLK